MILTDCSVSDDDDDDDDDFQAVGGVLEGTKRNPTSCSWKPYYLSFSPNKNICIYIYILIKVLNCSQD